MDKEKRNERMEACWADYQGRNPGFSERPSYTDYTEGFIAGAGYSAANDWVAVSDRLPGANDYFLVTVHPRIVRRAFFDIEDGFVDAVRHRDPMYGVLAWREIPAPYQSERQPKEGE